MSRKSDIDECLYLWASSKLEVSEALKAAYKLGRAQGLIDGSKESYKPHSAIVRKAGRLRAKVRKAGETK